MSKSASTARCQNVCKMCAKRECQCEPTFCVLFLMGARRPRTNLFALRHSAQENVKMNWQVSFISSTLFVLGARIICQLPLPLPFAMRCVREAIIRLIFEIRMANCDGEQRIVNAIATTKVFWDQTFIKCERAGRQAAVWREHNKKGSQASSRRGAFACHFMTGLFYYITLRVARIVSRGIPLNLSENLCFCFGLPIQTNIITNFRHLQLFLRLCWLAENCIEEIGRASCRERV